MCVYCSEHVSKKKICYEILVLNEKSGYDEICNKSKLWCRRSFEFWYCDIYVEL